MRLGVNVPNFGPGTGPGALRAWAQTVEGLGFDLLMVSDHVVVTPDVAEQYPEPFYEPFTTLAWLAGITSRVRLGTTVLVAAYRHPLLTARMAANLNDLSGGRLVIGVGAGWARQEFEALGVPYARRGPLTDATLRAIPDDIPVWAGGNSDAAMRRAVRLADAWHPLRNTIGWLREAASRMTSMAGGRSAPALVPRIALRITAEPVTGPERLAGEGTIEQVMGDLEELRRLGAEAVVLDPFDGDPDETVRPGPKWQRLATIAAHWDLERP
jgi:alkanesulfonate monooxygenase SsuD/methylene tetrahydromethanopterin reductase-like flavin-dependent oxidoreductase (luciferase family)